MRLAPLLFGLVTAAALVGASPARCLAGMPDAAPRGSVPVETPPCHQAPTDAPRPALPAGTAPACCAAPATAPDAPVHLAAPVVTGAVVWLAVETVRPQDVAPRPSEAEPPDRWAGPVRVVTGCFRI